MLKKKFFQLVLATCIKFLTQISNYISSLSPLQTPMAEPIKDLRPFPLPSPQKFPNPLQNPPNPKP